MSESQGSSGSSPEFDDLLEVAAVARIRICAVLALCVSRYDSLKDCASLSEVHEKLERGPFLMLDAALRKHSAAGRGVDEVVENVKGLSAEWSGTFDGLVDAAHRLAGRRASFHTDGVSRFPEPPQTMGDLVGFRDLCSELMHAAYCTHLCTHDLSLVGVLLRRLLYGDSSSPAPSTGSESLVAAVEAMFEAGIEAVSAVETLTAAGLRTAGLRV